MQRIRQGTYGVGDLQLVGKGRIADVFTWGDSQVLKLFGVGYDDVSIEAEALVSRRVHEAGVVTPRCHGIVTVDGRRGIIYDRASGTSMLTQLTASPWKLFRFGHILANLHASIHDSSAHDLPSQCERLARLITQAQLPIALRDLALARLREMPDGTAVCHGDFHPDNVLTSLDESVVIDWTTGCVGNPVADFAITSLILRLGAPLPGASLPTRMTIHAGRTLFRRVYSKRYLQIRRMNLREIRKWDLPIAVARLGENVRAERNQLLTFIDRASRAGVE